VDAVGDPPRRLPRRLHLAEPVARRAIWRILSRIVGRQLGESGEQRHGSAEAEMKYRLIAAGTQYRDDLPSAFVVAADDGD
jgi:hypothetical protein